MADDTKGQWEPVRKIPVPIATLYDPFDATRTIKDARGLFVVHAVLLCTGKILCFSGHVEGMYYDARYAYLYDPREPATTQLTAVKILPEKTDLFCCHYVQLYDGRILVVGGSQQDDATDKTKPLKSHGSEGAQTLIVFDPFSESFTPLGLSLEQGRWYPTVVLNADGEAVVLSGRRESGQRTAANPFGIADAVEVISARADKRRTLAPNPTSPPRLPIYPGAHLAPNGNIYTTHTTWGQEVPEPPSYRLTLGTGASWNPLPLPAAQPKQVQREEGMSVPLPVTKPRANTRGRYLIVGGGQAMGFDGTTEAPMAQLGGISSAVYTRHAAGVSLKSAEILDTTATQPTWTLAPGLTSERVNCHCVLLPDATIAVIGGHDGYKWQAKVTHTSSTQKTTMPSMTVELYKPGHGFAPDAAMTVPRMYHSVAVLLPDGRVWVAGGADPNEHEPWLDYPAGWKGRRNDGRTDPGKARDPTGPRQNGQPDFSYALNRKDYQIYKPPYLCKGLPQPKITDIKPGFQVLYGGKFTITTPQAATISHVAIMRPGAPTHHTDTEQRYVELDFTATGGDDIAVTMVGSDEANVVTPGYYMVWIIDNQGIPCERAKFIQVTYPPPWPPQTAAESKRRSCWPCIIATVAMGSAAAPDVVFLRSVRDELAASGAAGRRFIAAVHCAYYAFSPQTARWLERHPRWRAATRDMVVRPGAACIRAARRAADHLPWPAARAPALIAMLAVEGVLATAAAPILAILMLAHVAVRGDHG
jgi:hypothetical protein